MNSQTPFERHRQLRDVAILMAGLDDSMAQSLLDSMPAKDATAVLAEIDALDNIDPEEQREIAEKFRRSLAPRPTTKVEGVELDASLLAKIESHDSEYDLPTNQVSQQPLEALSSLEASAIIEILSVEHPQTIAIVLSRIDASKAAELMSKLPLSLQAEVLARMGNLDTADEQTVQVVESQLADWIEQQRQRKQRQAAGLELVQRILEHTPDAQRQTILTHMGKNTPTPSTQTAVKAKPTPLPRSRVENASPVLTKGRYSSFQGKTPNKLPARQPEPIKIHRPPEVNLSEDPLTELEQADDATLMAALSQTDRQVGALALAGASDQLMKRVLRGLPRSQAKTMRLQLRTIGPTRLSDMITAQQQLLQSVRLLATQ